MPSSWPPNRCSSRTSSSWPRPRIKSRSPSCRPTKTCRCWPSCTPASRSINCRNGIRPSRNWREAAKDFPDNPYTAEILYEQGWALQNLGKTDEAFKQFEEAAGQSDGLAGARARFMMGEILFEKKEYKEAVRNFFKVAYGFGYPQAPEAIQKWQANSAYEAGRCFEVLKMTAQAKKSYQEVVDKYPNSDKAQLAKARLAEL